MSSLEAKIAAKRARVGVLGLGYVGLPLALAFARRGFSVLGFDTDAARAASLNRGRSHIPDVDAGELAEETQAGRLRASHKFDGLSRCDAVIICVPTPLRKSRDPDVSYIQRACESLLPRLRRGMLVVLESTTYPGTTREMVAEILGRSGLRSGKDFHLAFSPERVDPSNKNFGIDNTPKVVGGLTPACGKLAGALYAQIVDKIVPVSSADAAEMVKLLENTFRAVNIALVNEVALMCSRLNLDVWEIVGAAATKPFGFMPFYPGPGLGGHCIPVDPSFLAWKMKSLNFESRFIGLAEAINSRMPEYTASRVAEYLNESGKAVRGSRILVLGAAYKPEVNDVRESPATDVISLLLGMGAKVEYSDPFVPRLKVGRRPLKSVSLTPAALKACDLAVILTAHKAFDMNLILKHAARVFDARNASAGRQAKNLRRL